VGSTEGHAASGRGGAADARSAELARAAELVARADGLIAEVVAPGRWPRRRTVERFLDGDRLQRVLGLYTEAMRLDPDEPAYPWNLASTLNRLGLNELALGFIERAIRIARTAGDAEWADASAHLAWAEVAEHAGQYEVALVALARAKSLANGSAEIGVSIERERRAIERALQQQAPERALARELDALSS
jgi:tetratricopeptide (TPR) repeat protein